MAIQLHNLVTFGKRYIQVETQPHHITGIWRTIIHSYEKLDENQVIQVLDTIIFECEEDGTITFYQPIDTDTSNSKIWTYMVYECLEDEEKVFRDFSLETSTNCLQELFAERRINLVAINILEYLKYQVFEKEYLEVSLPKEWNNPIGKEIANLLLEEYQAIQNSILFTENMGRKYIKTILNEFIEAGWKTLENCGMIRDFELIQSEILNNTKITEIANLIVESNDYRLWQQALPSKSKAVEYAFKVALDLICRIK